MIKKLIGLSLLSLSLLSSCGSPSFPLASQAHMAIRPQMTALLQSPLLQIAGKSAPFKRDANAFIRQFHQELQQRAPELIRLKYQAMAEAPFPFYRATAFLFYHDIRQVQNLNSPVQVTLQGDFHLENMGTYRTTQGRYAYDLNDFDEAFKGPYTWDIARLATSVHLAAEEVGIKGKDQEKLVALFIERYLTHLTQVLRQPALLNQPLDERYLTEKPAKQVRQAAEFRRPHYLAEEAPNGKFAPSNKLVPVPANLAQQVAQGISHYAAQRPEGAPFYHLKDLRSRIAGKGSLGRYRYVALVEGPSPSHQDDLILEFKEAIVPSAYAFTRQRTAQNGQRIVQAYRYFLPQVDPFLGTTQIHGLDFFVRELLPKETVNLEKVNKISEYEAFLDSVALIAARGHARSGQGQHILADAGSAQQLQQRIGPFARDYFEQVVADQKAFRKAF